MSLLPVRRKILMLAGSVVALALAGCASPPTAVSTETQFQPDEGLVALRLVDTGSVTVRRFVVASTTTGKEFPLRAVRFGQTSGMTYVGRLPAGRYRPVQLFGARGLQTLTVPLKELTGEFEVQARRVTELGTMVFAPTGQYRDEKRDAYGSSRKVQFVLPLDPTPVAVQALLAARFPELAKGIEGQSSLGWVPGTTPVQPAGLMDTVRAHVDVRTPPRKQADGAWLAGGSLGAVARLSTTRQAPNSGTGAVQAIESVLQLRDGRWLAGGEEGFLAVSADQGGRWQRLAGLGVDEVVIHLAQAPDGQVFMVTDRDREAVVYKADAATLGWQVLRRLPSDREQGILTQEFGEAPAFLPDYAAASAERLVVHTRSGTLSSLDFKTGQWETHETPRTFRMGLQVTPDGFVVGAMNQYWVYGTLDYGKTWNRLEAYTISSVPHFIDRHRGIVFAAEMSMTGPKPFRYFHTEDGGKSWKPGAEVGRYWDAGEHVWMDPNTATLHRTVANRVLSSRDQGVTWR
jgi:hypothetical protein